MSVPDIAGEDEKDKLTTRIFKCTGILLKYLLKCSLLEMCQVQANSYELATGSSNGIWKQLLFKRNRWKNA